MLIETDTIAAIATPPGQGGIGVIRVSGENTRKIAEKILKHIPPPRHASYLPFYDEKQKVLDQGIALFFPKPNSFTGEDVLELQGHGGTVVLNMLLKIILNYGARLAQPGEFLERAFHHDKLDLAQAEAVADLINASSEQAARSAVKSLQGEFSQLIQQLVDGLIELRIYVEAAIDFPEEEIDFLADKKISGKLQHILEQLENVTISAKQGKLLREGINVVIAGEPNAGKSSLLNCLAEKEIAIVSEVAGTTRDVLREHIHIDGMPLHIIDTAGLRNSEDTIEKEGIRRAINEIEQADLILLMIDATKLKKERDVEKQIPTNIRTFLKIKPFIIIKNKIDLLPEPPRIEKGQYQEIYLSAKSKQGIELLKQLLKESVGFNNAIEGIFTARTRHLIAIEEAKQFLEKGKQQLETQKAGELLAEDLRHAQNKLSEITGEFAVDDLLGKIFSSFCIGK